MSIMFGTHQHISNKLMWHKSCDVMVSFQSNQVFMPKPNCDHKAMWVRQHSMFLYVRWCQMTHEKLQIWEMADKMTLRVICDSYSISWNHFEFRGNDKLTLQLQCYLTDMLGFGLKACNVAVSSSFSALIVPLSPVFLPNSSANWL